MTLSNSDSPNPCTGNDYFRYMVAASRFAVIGADPQGRILNCNDAAVAMFHMPAADMIGKNLESIIPSHLTGILRENMLQAAQKNLTTEFELDLMDENQNVQFLAMVISPILDNEHQLLGLAAWVRDITNRKTLERQLVHAEKMASLGTLASGVAHHFNNIFGGVATFVDFAIDSNDPVAIRRAMQMTADAAGRVGQITRSLLTFAEKDALDFDMSDLTEVVLTFAHLVENSLNQKKINLNLHMQAIPVIEVPASRIHQVLGNLLDNAEQAMPNGGTINLALEQKKEAVILTMTDSGSGIDANDLPHIFEPFFTTRGVIGGGDHPAAGLGLSVVHGIVRELNAKIEAKSTKGKGASFCILFPIPKPKIDKK